MTVLDIPAQVTVDALIKVVTQLPSDELEEFLTRINIVRQRQTNEADLLAVVQHQRCEYCQSSPGDTM